MDSLMILPSFLVEKLDKWMVKVRKRLTHEGKIITLYYYLT